MISERKWLSYLDVQMSGLTNMFDIVKVQELANIMNQVELTREDIIYIMENYRKLKEKYGVGGVNVDIKSM